MQDNWYAVVLTGMFAFGIVMIFVGVSSIFDSRVMQRPLDPDLQPDEDIREIKGL